MHLVLLLPSLHANLQRALAVTMCAVSTNRARYLQTVHSVYNTCMVSTKRAQCLSGVPPPPVSPSHLLSFQLVIPEWSRARYINTLLAFMLNVGSSVIKVTVKLHAESQSQHRPFQSQHCSRHNAASQHGPA